MHLPRARGEQVRLAAIAVVVLAGAWFVSNQFDDLKLEELMRDIADALGAWTYLLAGLLAFLETGAFVGLVVPGETFVIVAGAVSGQGATDIYVTIAIVWFSAWAGDTTSFFIGRRLGREFILRHGPKLRITEERFAQVEGYFQRHGGKTILIGRFIGLVRALAPFVAGSSGMRYRGFLPYSVLGTGLWAAGFCLLGYFFSQSIDELANAVGEGLFLFATVVFTIVAVVVAVRVLREPRNRAAIVEWMERRALLRPLVALGRRVKPQARFAWNRVTPGNLGLEFTALMAVLAVALFVLVAYTSIVSGDAGPTRADQTALDIAREIETGWLTSLAEGVTALGTGAFTLAVAVVAGVALALRRRWAEVAVLVVALVIVHVGVPIIKDAVDRPRPPDPLVGASGSSFPSGHAANAAIYAWIAITVVVRLRPGRAHGAAIVAAGIVLAALIGLSRVYLRVHYLSDVGAGWALGAAAFAACAAVALVATHLERVRNNEPDRDVSLGGGAPPSH
jgi:membrane protein DedA with SNARE-associated domain/membrane-associated phospholipid phosphatase